MKTLLLGSMILSFSLFLNLNVNSQELVKPVPNKEAKKLASPKKMETNTTSNETLHSKSKAELSKSEVSETENYSGSIIKEEKPQLATKDVDDYQERKIKWIADHPEKYKAYSNNPNLVIMTEEELKKLSLDEQNRILADEANYIIIK